MSVSVFSSPLSGLRTRRVCCHVVLTFFVVALLFSSAILRAQTATFSGPPSLVNGTGSFSPTGVAVDSSGNVYVATGSGGANQIMKVTPGGGSSVLNISGYTLSGILQLTVDSSGYLYIVDHGNNRVLKAKTDGTNASVIPAGALNGPQSVAVDPSGNVFIGDGNASPSRVVKVPYSAGTYGSPSDFVSSSASIGSGGTLQFVPALATDSSGNVLVIDIDSAGTRLIKVTPTGTASELITNTQSIGAGGTLYTTYGVEADAQGDIFIADQEAIDFKGRIVELPYSAGSYGAPLDYVSGASNIVNTPNGMTIDSKGTLYVTDYAPDAENSGTGGVIEIATQSTDFGSVAAGSTSSTYSLNFVFSSAGSLNSTTPYKVLTLGATGLDFAVVTSGTTCSGSFGAGASCTVKASFTPAYAGLRQGAVQLFNSSGGVVVTAYVRGTGTGPQVAFSPGTQKTLGGGFNVPEGVAVDGSGNVYVADSSNNAVKKIPSGCTSSSCVTTLGGGFVSPMGVAVDAIGNVYVADQGNNAVKQMSSGCASFSCVTTLGGGFSTPEGVAVDGSGNIYVADKGNSAVKEMPAGCASSSCVTVLGGGFNAATGVAVDGSSNIYVADQGNNAVKKMSSTCTSSSCVTTLGGGFSAPAGVAVGGTGTIYVADQSNNAVKEMSSSCASSSCVTTVSGSFTSLFGVAVDGGGNLYAGDSSNAYVVELDRYDAPSLSFSSTTVGQTSSTQSTTLENIGNSTLTFPVPTTGNNPSIAANFTLDNSTTCPELTTSSSAATLTAGASCLLAVDFAPTATGSITGSLVVKDNHLNAAGPGYTTQSLSLSGTGQASAPGAPTIGTVTAGNGQVTVNFTPPSSDGGATITGYTATSSPSGFTGSCAASPCIVTGLTNGTAYTFTVTATNSVGTSSASAASASVTPKASQTITFNNPGTQNFGTTPTLTATATSGLTVTFSSSTTGICTITSGGALTFVTAGTCTIAADQAGNSSYLAASTVTQSFSVAAVVPGAPTIGTATAGNAQATVSFTAPSSNGGATITGYTVTSNPGGITGSCAASPCAVTGLTNGTAYTFTVTATNSAGIGSASAASGSVTPKGTQTITFNNPGTQNFGTTPTLTATATSGLTVAFTSSTTGVCTVTSGGALTFVTTGTCTINADQAGNSSYLAAPTVIQSFSVAAVVPGAPTIGSVTAGNGQATVNFAAPSSNGGAAITGYTVTSTPGSFTGSCAASPCTVTGLTNGTAYTFTVTATNSAGTGSASASSASVTPKSSQTITFNNPGTQNFGTTPTLAATATSGLTVTFSSGTTGVCTVTSGGALTFVTAGTCTINADQSGSSSYLPAPTATQSFTVAAVVPGAPTIGPATAGNQQATVNFIAPVFTGGVAITGYTVTSSPGGFTGSCAASPCTVTGLKAATSYTFTVTATNTVGTGAASAASNSITTPIGNLVVTTAVDDAGTASNCTSQSSPGTGTDTSCSLRDALTYAAAAGAANISFDGTVFAAANTSAQNTITLTNGTLAIPAATSIQGATAGSGTTLKNLVTVSGNSTYEVFSIASGVTGAKISNLTIANGKSSSGGGIANNGTLTIANSTFSGNTANGTGLTDGGGAISNAGTLTITNSTFSGNSANGTLHGGGAIANTSTLTVTGGTFSGNTANGTGSSSGGAISNFGTLTATSSTLSGNSADNGGGLYSTGTLNLANSVVIGNSAIYTHADISGSYTDNGGNLANTGTGTASTVNPSLAPLGNYGGPTQTLLPLPGSPAVCAGTLANVGSITADQRGEARTTTYSGTTCADAGAVESNYSVTFTQQPGDEPTATTLAPALTVQLNESGSSIALSGVSISISAASGTLNGTATESTGANGQASFANLSIGTPQSGDTLIASVTLTATGSPAIAASATSSTFNITSVAPTITFAVADHTYDDAAFAVSATSNSTGTITYSVVSGPATVLGNIVTLTGAGTVTLQASQASSGGYSAATQDATFHVAKAIPAVSWTTPAAIPYGTALTSAQLNASSTVAGSFIYSPAAGTLLSAGAQTLSVTFAPTDTTNYMTATATVNLTVSKTSVVVSGPPVTLAYGSTGTATVTVAGRNSGAAIAVPSGSVSYSINGGSAQTELLTNGAATLNIPGTLAAGSSTINVTYAGDSNYQSGTGSVALTIGAGVLTVSANNATKVYGTPNPTFAGSISGALHGDTFTESFATVATISSNVGSYAIVPSAAGANLGSYTETIQNGTLTVTQAGSVVALTSSAANANQNANVTLTATVTSTTTGTPTGTVQFLEGSTVLASSQLNAQGVATYSTANFAVGAHSIRAVYSGDQNFTGSSVTFAQQVTAPDYSLTANPSSLTLKAGQTGKVIFTFAPVGGYIGAVNFACAGLPENTSCSFAPTSLTADGSNKPQTSLLTITTQGPNTGTVTGNESQGSGSIGAASIFWLPGLLSGCFLVWQRKKLSVSAQRLLAMLILVAVFCWATGCGFKRPQAPGGANVVTVTATATATASAGGSGSGSGSNSGSDSGAASHTATFTLTITQ